MSSETLIPLIIVLGILVVFSSFFSAAETAYSSVSRSQIETKIKQGKKSAVLIKKHYKMFGSTLATILICNNLINIAASTLITLLFTSLLDADALATVLSTCVMTPIIVIFGEIFPKLFAKKHAYSYLAKIAFTMEVIRIIFLPFTFFLSKAVLSSKVTNSEKELKTLLSLAKSEGVLDANEATLASKALDLDSTTLNSVITKKEDIVSIKSDATVGKALKLISKSGHSRIPVKENRTYIGLIILKDIILQDPSSPIKDFLVPLHSISKNVLATKALEEMRMKQSHMILVKATNDSSKVVGICTLEDIIEELIGEIYDEHDSTLKVREIAHFTWRAEGSIKLSVFEKETRTKLESDDKEMTIKQWVQSRIQRKIRTGLKYTYDNSVVFKILTNKNGQETILKITKK